MQAENTRPAILCFGGLDPSGGAGLQADIEAIAYCGGHALPMATCLTVQNSVQAFSVAATDEQLLHQQAEALLQDIPVASCKIGVIPNSKIAETIAGIIAQIPDIPVILDPVLSASKGSQFSDTATIDTIKDILLPMVSVVTPNMTELAALTSENHSAHRCASELCSYGAKHVLLTNADSQAPEVSNALFTADGLVEEYRWPKLPHAYHGSGCTLSSALAYFLTNELDVSAAARLAQQYTWQSLQSAESLGHGQWIPNRVFTNQVK